VVHRRAVLRLFGLVGPAFWLAPGLPIRLAEASPLHRAAPADDDPYRLPRTVVPERYAVTIAPDFAASSFSGEVAIAVQIHEPVPEIVLNAADLGIVEAYLLDASMARLEGAVTLQPARERVRIRFAEIVQSGAATLHLRFSGRFNDQLRGLYLAMSEGGYSVSRVMATTQFESTDARRAFPCWDEPDFKATFDVTLVVDRGLTAISNGALLSETPRDGGKVAVTFATSPKMSTYLVALFVGPLAVSEPLVVDGIPLRVAQLGPESALHEAALEIGAFSLRFFNQYFGTPYPADKLN
jgi:puromycin-sensitive aminopeptidase